MREQMELPGLVNPSVGFELDATDGLHGRAQRYDLYLALVPEDGDAVRIHTAGSTLCERYLLSEGVQPLGRLHITLHALATFSAHWVPREPIDAVINAISCSAQRPSFPISFDRVSGSQTGAFVFRCGKDSAARIGALRNSLAHALRRAGMKPKPSYTPHMTVCYCCSSDIEQVIEPIHWTARRCVLLLSHVGVGHHQWVREWPLTSITQPA